MSDSTPPATNAGSPILVDSLISEEERETESVHESALDYPVHWGRTYPRYKEYNYPNDEPELERYDLMHHVFTRIHGLRLFFAPVQDARRVLDVGTGTGVCKCTIQSLQKPSHVRIDHPTSGPIELSDSCQMPHVERITGVDLSPIQPTDVPDNVFFEIQDCSETNWQRPRSSIDYIHVRMMLGSLKDPSALIRNAKRYLRPGTGWIEWHDPLPMVTSDDDSIPPNWAYAEWEHDLNRAAKSVGYPVRVAHKMKRWMEEAGYVDVHEHINKLPIGKWPRDPELKNIGLLWGQAVSGGLSAISNKVFHDGLDWNRAMLETFLVSVRQSLAMKGVHAYHKLYVVCGRRPSEQEEQELMTQRVMGGVNGH